MNKYSEAIETDFYKLIQATTLGTSIGGKIYKYGFRPELSKEEDIIVEYKEGIEAGVQVGFVYVRIYVPNITIDSTSRKNAKRCIEIQDMVGKMYRELNKATSEYLVECHNTPMTISEHDIKQHYVSAFIKYKRLKIKE